MKIPIYLILFCFGSFIHAQTTFQTAFESPDWAIGSVANDIALCENGDIYAVGTTGSGSILSKIRLARVDQFGITQLDTIYTFTPLYEFTPKVTSTPDGGAIVACFSHSYPIDDLDGDADILVWKISPKGEIEWQKVIAATNFIDLKATSDGNFLMLGIVARDNRNVQLTKINDSGNVLWQSILGETWEGGQPESAVHLAEINHNYYVTSRENYADWPGGNGVMYRVNEKGSSLWRTELERDVITDYISIKHPFKFNGEYYFRIPKSNRLFRFSSETGEYFEITDSLKLYLDDFVMSPCGYEDEIAGVFQSEEDKFVFKKYFRLDTSYYSRNLSEVNSFKKIIRANDGGFILLSDNMTITKMDCYGNIDSWNSECGSKIPANSIMTLYPNPVKNSLIIEAEFDFEVVTLINSVGQTVKYQNDCNCNRKILNVNSLSSGVYSILVKGETEQVLSRFVKY